MPINTNTLRGSEAVLQLAGLDTRAGKLGQEIFDKEYSISTVGRVTGVEICVDTALETFHEIGTRLPVSLHPGNINIRGRVDRAYINGALLRLLMGNLVKDLSSTDELQPQFNIILDLTDIKSADGKVGTKVTVGGVRFENWSLVVPEDDFVMEKVTFQAVRITREEKTGGG